MKKKKRRRIKFFGIFVTVFAVVLFLSLCPQYRYVLAEKIGARAIAETYKYSHTDGLK